LSVGIVRWQWLSACRESLFALTPFRIGDCIKVIESADKPGTWVQVRNSLFFQKPCAAGVMANLPPPANSRSDALWNGSPTLNSGSHF
jgi:hypothetical protein